MNLTLIPKLLDCFRKGSAVADVVKAKNYGALGIALGALLAAVGNAAKATGHDIHLDTDTAAQIGTGIAALAGLFVTYGTSKTVGFLPAKPGNGAPGDTPAGRVEQPAAPVGGISADTRAAAEVWARRQADNVGGP